jgi:excisionase family DNA binding protein
LFSCKKELQMNTRHDPKQHELLDVDQVAELLNCSSRHIYRLADAGLIPRPVKLGVLNRWPRAAICEWIAGGCQPTSTASPSVKS